MACAWRSMSAVYSRLQQILDLEHYLEVLEQKPGALRGSSTLAEWRAQGRWRAQLRRSLGTDDCPAWTSERHASHDRAAAHAGREFGYTEAREAAVAQSSRTGVVRMLAAIRHLLLTNQLQHRVMEPVEIGALVAYERPLPTMAEYNQLLSSTAVTMEVQA